MKCIGHRQIFSNNDRFDYNFINNDVIGNSESFIDKVWYFIIPKVNYLLKLILYWPNNVRLVSGYSKVTQLYKYKYLFFSNSFPI